MKGYNSPCPWGQSWHQVWPGIPRGPKGPLGGLSGSHLLVSDSWDSCGPPDSPVLAPLPCRGFRHPDTTPGSHRRV